MTALAALVRAWPLCLLAFASSCTSHAGGKTPPPPLVVPDPIGGVATAPSVPLTQTLELNQMVDTQLESFFARRADRMGMAVEPGERGIIARTDSPRLHKEFPRLEAHFNAGEEIFEFEFTLSDGFGSGIGGPPPSLHRVHRGAHGGPDTTSCKSCHHRGGDDGAGEYPEAAFTGGDGENTRRANERNAPMILGGGALQILAAEITKELQTQGSVVPGMEYDRDLEVQGVHFGKIHVRKDGTVDTSKLLAIDPDLVVRPFGWKGTQATLRRFAEEAFQVHHGLQSEVLVNLRREFSVLPRDTSPATMALIQSLGDGPPRDPDKDGIFEELNGLYLTSISVYLGLLPLPAIDPPKAPDLLVAFREGEAAFRKIGCADCHKPSWMLKNPVWTEHAEGGPQAEDLVLDLRKDIQRGPQLRNTDTLTYGEYPIYLYSDLRRHDMGPELADTYAGPPAPHGQKSVGPQIPPSYFLTRPLWGLADTAPYLHDGRAVTIPEAILAHGGEADKARKAYSELPEAKQRAIHVFLLSLTRPAVPEVVP